MVKMENLTVCVSNVFDWLEGFAWFRFLQLTVAKVWRSLKTLSPLLILVVFFFAIKEIRQIGSAMETDNWLATKLEETQMKLDLCHQEQFQQDGIRNKIDDTAQHYIVSEGKKGFTGEKLVHIDLKGAPPKMDYLLQVLPILKSLGATGILIEYEDMFPYKGILRKLRSADAYSYADIKRLLAKTKDLSLSVVPLVQTFGHLEFVLKHKNFQNLRETPKYPNAPCPLKTMTLKVVLKMIDQVMEQHPGITRLHVGGDEVFNLKTCNACMTNKMSKAELYNHHMVPIFKHVILQSSGAVFPIIWDDMLRRWTTKEMQPLASLVEIMVWGYVPKLDGYALFTDDMWDKYSKVFKNIWVASSFKGDERCHINLFNDYTASIYVNGKCAIAPNANLPPGEMHINNHLSWLKKINEMENKLQVKGVALTGWTRFDHFAALCELLPVAIPVLGICLRVLQEGTLGLKNGIQIRKETFGSYDTSQGDFAGSEVYSLAAELQNHVSWYKNTKIRLDSWGNKRQEESSIMSPLQVEGAKETLKQLVPSLNNLRKKSEDVLSKYFFESAVKEWIKDKIDIYIDLADQLARRTEKITKQLEVDR